MSFSGVVHREGLEPSRACAPTVLSRGCLPIPNHLCMVPRAGLEPARAFAPPVLSRRCLPIPNHLGVVRAARIELACSCSRNRRDNHCPTPGWSELRGSNPSCPVWKAGVTPGDLARMLRKTRGSNPASLTALPGFQPSRAPRARLPWSVQRESDPHPMTGSHRSYRWTMHARAEAAGFEPA